MSDPQSLPHSLPNCYTQNLKCCSLSLAIGLISATQALASPVASSDEAEHSKVLVRTVDQAQLTPLELKSSAWQSAAQLMPISQPKRERHPVDEPINSNQADAEAVPEVGTFDSSIKATTVQSSDPANLPAADGKTMPRYVSALPRLFAAAPRVLPPESNHSNVEASEQTANLSWVDKRRTGLHNWIDQTAGQMNSWFEGDEPTKTAKGSLRLILDQAYSQTDGFQTNVRLRGKLKLPALEDKVSLVFGDDRLDDELGSQTDPANPALEDTQRSLTLRQTREENNSIALRISELSDRLPFDTDLDFGLRSGDDPFVRLKIDRSFDLPEDFNFYAAQIYRFGAQSGDYLQTNIELAHAPAGQALIADQLKITSAETESDDIRLSNRLFRQHQFFKNQRFQYGLYQGGYVDSGSAKLNAYGPYTSWRQPFMRDWFFVQADLNYFNNEREELNHEPSGLLRLEALF